MGRIEYKYLVASDLLDSVRAAIAEHVRPDRFAENRENHEYVVRSLYYDTSRFDFYHEKIEGLRKRKKIRVRGYNELNGDDWVFLEIKRKFDAAISKTRVPVAYEDLADLIASADIDAYFPGADGDEGIARESAEQFLFHVKNLSLEPVVLIVYNREAYPYRFNDDLRITFDKDLRSLGRVSVDSLFQEGDFIRALPRQFILEIKTGGIFPSWLTHMIASLELTRRALSKYTICMDRHWQKEIKQSRLGFVRKQVGPFNQQSNREVA